MNRSYKQNVLVVLTLLLFLWWLLTGCRTKTVYVPVHSVTTVTETVRDTVIDVQLVPYKDSVTVRDTVSRLENPYASSVAVWSEGTLSHSLSVKDISVPVKTEYREIVRTDSIRVPYPVDKIIEKNVLRWWQSALMWAGGSVLLLIIIFLIRKIL